MAVEFHCEHCRHLIRAPNDSAGKKGRCPHCQNVVYIPSPPEDSGEIPLSPVDEEFERRQKAAEQQRHALERNLYGERAMPGEPGKPQRGSASGANRDAAGGPAARPGGDPRALVREFVSAMAEGRLADADRVAFALGQMKSEALAVIEALSGGNAASAPELSKLPRPVLLGFLKQLVARL